MVAINIVSIFVEVFMILPFEEGWCDYTVATTNSLLQQDATNCVISAVIASFQRIEGVSA